MEAFFEGYNLIVNILIVGAIIVHFLTRRNNEERVYLLVAVVGFFALLYIFSNDWYVAQAFIAAWVIFIGVETIASKTVLLAMLVLMLFVQTTSPLFYLISMAFYAIIIGGFILSAFRELKQVEAIAGFSD